MDTPLRIRCRAGAKPADAPASLAEIQPIVYELGHNASGWPAQESSTVHDIAAEMRPLLQRNAEITKLSQSEQQRDN